MGDAQRGVDALAFYAADIGETRLIAASAVSAQIPDDDGALTQGRWLIYILDATTTDKVWIQFGPFEATVTLTAVASPGMQRVVLSPSGLVAIEVNILKGYNDRVAVITEADPANVYLTKISRMV